MLDEEEVFMEVVEETHVPVEFVSNRKRVREDSNGGVGPNYNIKEVD